MGLYIKPDRLLELQERNESRRSPVTPNAKADDPKGEPPIGVTPFIRENDVNFAVVNLKPEANANIFFDEIQVNRFCQRASYVNANSSVYFNTIRINEPLYGKTSKAYAEVLGSSLTGTDNLLYLNENFLSIKVSGPSISASDYSKNDYIYQTTSNSMFYFDVWNGASFPVLSFFAKVKNWEVLDATNGVLTVEPLSGDLMTSQINAGLNAIFNQSNFIVTARAATDIYANNKFSVNEEVVRAGTSEILFKVSNHAGLSGQVLGAGTNVRSIVLSSNNIVSDGISNIVGNNITIVSGTNMGFRANVVAIANNANYGMEAIVDADMPQVCSSNSVYSIGNHVVNDVGAMYGIFHIPSYTTIRWLTGERVFTVTDTATYNDNNYGMRAVGKYTALGKVDSSENARNSVLLEMTPSTRRAPQKSTEDTQKVNDRKFMCQTFFTPKGNAVVNGQVKTPFGIYVTSIDLFFKSKPVQNDELLPFTVGISKVQNGIPANDLIASRTLEPAYINTSNTPSVANVSTLTKFSFKDPVYLLPETEYAIKLMTESDVYEVWTATLGGEYFDGTTSRRISEQPYSGNFFKSQNASNWNPILNQDLMFQINRAAYESSNTYYFTIDPSKSELNKLGAEFVSNTVYDAIKISSSGEQTKAPTSITYAVKTTLADGTQTDFIKVNNNEVYEFIKDTSISTASSRRRRAIFKGDSEAINVRVTMATTDDTVSPVLNYEQISAFTLENVINNAGIANTLVTITNPGSHANAANIAITITPPDVGSDIATANVLPGMLSGGKLLAINITNPGSGYFSTPEIFIAEPGATTNATAVISGETDAVGGNILCKYQTKMVTLKEGFDAGDLVVRLDAIKPVGTDVAVYFKILSSQDFDNFSAKKWKLMTKVRDNVSADSTKRVPLEYRYSLNKGSIEYTEGDKTYPIGGTFKQFAVKIRLTTNDPSNPPSVESLRVIAVPGG